jgi:hypothetical protein
MVDFGGSVRNDLKWSTVCFLELAFILPPSAFSLTLHPSSLPPACTFPPDEFSECERAVSFGSSTFPSDANVAARHGKVARAGRYRGLPMGTLLEPSCTRLEPQRRAGCTSVTRNKNREPESVNNAVADRRLTR